MESKVYGYIQFPLCLLQETHKDVEKALNLMIDYGIVSYALKLKYNIRDVAKQVCYYYYRKQEVLQASIRKQIDKAIDKDLFTLDEDYNGFNGYEKFNPEENISEILVLFNENDEFKSDSILHYQIHLATSKDHLGITIYSNDDTIQRYNEAVQLKQKFENRYGPDAMPMCPKNILFDFRDKQQDLDVFRALIGIRSLIGFRNYIATTRPVILMRMLGCKSKKALDMFLQENEAARELYQKYARSRRSLEYHFNKLFSQLLSRGFIKSKIFMRSVSRKIFLSINLNYDQLTSEIIEFAKKRNFKHREDEAIRKIRCTI